MLTAKDLKVWKCYKVLAIQDDKEIQIIIKYIHFKLQTILFVDLTTDLPKQYLYLFDDFDNSFNVIRELTEESNTTPEEKPVIQENEYIVNDEILTYVLEIFFYHVNFYKVQEIDDGFSKQNVFCDRFPGATEFKTLSQVVNEFIAGDDIKKQIFNYGVREKRKKKAETVQQSQEIE